MAHYAGCFPRYALTQITPWTSAYMYALASRRDGVGMAPSTRGALTIKECTAILPEGLPTGSNSDSIRAAAHRSYGRFWSGAA